MGIVEIVVGLLWMLVAMMSFVTLKMLYNGIGGIIVQIKVAKIIKAKEFFRINLNGLL